MSDYSQTYTSPFESNADSSTVQNVPKIVAAGKGKSVSMPAIRDKIISLTKKESPTILYLGTASFDKTEPYLAQTKGFREAGCRILRVNVSQTTQSTTSNQQQPLCKRKRTTQYLKDQFDQADAILASGGDTSHALQRWKDVGIDKFIVKAAFREQNPAVLCGGSAGGICWFSYCHIIQKPEDLLKQRQDSEELSDIESDHDEDDDDDLDDDGSQENRSSGVVNKGKDEEELQLEYFRINGMNIVPALCVPHHDVKPDNALPRAEDSNRMTLRYSNIPTIGIDEAAALVLEGSRASVVSGDGKAKCYLKRCIYDKSKGGKRLKVTPKHHRDEQFDICAFFEKAKQ